MRAIEVYLNGNKLCTAGIDDDGVVLSNLTSKNGREATFDVAGVVSASREHVYWVRNKILSLGDKVVIQIVDAASVDEPAYRLGQIEHVRSKEEFVRELVEELGWKIQTPGNKSDC